jgi:DtxR family Mn-dependent transcriptional regulator
MVKPRRQRQPSGSVDRYLHAVLLLTDHGGVADTGDVARRAGVSAAAASRMLRRMAALGLVSLEPYQGAQLTADGLHRALRVVRRHRLIELFLHRVMGFDLRESHERAQRLQPAVDERFEDRLDEMLGRPTLDPHGQPIPARNATWPRLADVPLLDLPAGARGEVSRVTSEDAEAIAYLSRQGIAPGAAVELQGVAPYDGPAAVRVGPRVLHLGRRLAQLIHVRAADKPADGRSSRARKSAPSSPARASGRGPRTGTCKAQGIHRRPPGDGRNDSP